MARRTVFAPDEWYHCYNRGVEKRVTFDDEADGNRFLMLLYIANQERGGVLSDMGKHASGPHLHEVLARSRDSSLVDIGAYCLMPNHYHLLLRERNYDGISKFMQRVNTAYTMYFNLRHRRTGVLFDGRFKALHVSTNQYLQRAANYIHANSAELFEQEFKSGKIRDQVSLKKRLLAYEYSSLPDYQGRHRDEKAILNMNALLEVIETRPTVASLLADAKIYHRTMMSAD